METATAKTTGASKPLSRLAVLVVAVLGGTLAAGSLFYSVSRFSTAAQKAVPTVLSTVATTAATLGRLEPRGEVIQLAASSKGSRVEQLLVQRGDRVQAGQVLAVLDSRDRI